jgi:hypothetical protein
MTVESREASLEYSNKFRDYDIAGLAAQREYWAFPPVD